MKFEYNGKNIEKEEKLEQILKTSGLSFDEIIDIFIDATIQQGKLPFEYFRKVPNQNKIKAIDEGLQLCNDDVQIDHTIYNNINNLLSISTQDSKYKLIYTDYFISDVKLAEELKEDFRYLTYIIEHLSKQSKLDEGLEHITFEGKYYEIQECFIKPNRRLGYKIYNNVIVFLYYALDFITNYNGINYSNLLDEWIKNNPDFVNSKLELQDKINNWLTPANNLEREILFQLFLNSKYYSFSKIKNFFYNNYVEHDNKEKTVYSAIESKDYKYNSSNIYLNSFAISTADKINPKNILSSIRGIDSIGVTDIVFLDDIVGTGKTFIKFLTSNLVELSKVKIHLWVVCITKTAKDKIEKYQKENNIDINIKQLSIEKKAFETGYIFKSKKTCDYNKTIIKSYEEKIWGGNNNQILGYDKSQCVVSFYNNTPNNTLSSFWASWKTNKSKVNETVKFYDNLYTPIFCRKDTNKQDKTSVQHFIKKKNERIEDNITISFYKDHTSISIDLNKENAINKDNAIKKYIFETDGELDYQYLAEIMCMTYKQLREYISDMIKRKDIILYEGKIMLKEEDNKVFSLLIHYDNSRIFDIINYGKYIPNNFDRKFTGHK